MVVRRHHGPSPSGCKSLHFNRAQTTFARCSLHRPPPRVCLSPHCAHVQQSSQITPSAAHNRAAVFTPCAALVLILFDHEKKRVEEKSRAPATYGRPDVGGPFTLADQHGMPFTEKDLLGAFVVSSKTLPETSPLRLVKPVFISVDPARDSVEQVRRYALDFHPCPIALTGTYPTVNGKAYRIYLWSPPPKEGESQNYLIDHSIYFYLMDPLRPFVQAFGKINAAADVTERVLEEIGKWEGGDRGPRYEE
ncbi:SCO1-SenC-domain-containing protein [Ramaria rubella]|nr:SCO1-SenC-domain-containing protein [Ramaria rubella]